MIELIPKEILTFRFDDVCINSNMELHNSMTDYLLEKFPGCEVIWVISPLARSGCGERVYPKIWNAMSDYRQHYELDQSSPFPIHPKVQRAAHGLIHVDHRLLAKEAQEMSILVSASLTGSKMFVPPFNKYNADTQEICDTNGIYLIRFANGWLSMEHNKWNAKHQMWYFHAREWTMETFKKWFDNGNG